MLFLAPRSISKFTTVIPLICGLLVGLACLDTSFWQLNAALPQDASPVRSQAHMEISGMDLVNPSQNPIQFHFAKPKLATVVVFLSAVCPCSNSHLPELNKVYLEFSQQGFVFVGVHSNANENLQLSTDYFRQSKILFPVIQDYGAKIADHFMAYKTPHVFVVSPQGEVIYQGGVDDSRVLEKARHRYLRDALFAIQRGKEPENKNVRVLGCEISRP